MIFYILGFVNIVRKIYSIQIKVQKIQEQFHKQKIYKIEGLKRKDFLKTTFKKGGIDAADIGTHEDYVKPLMALFKRRGAK